MSAHVPLIDHETDEVPGFQPYDDDSVTKEPWYKTYKWWIIGGIVAVIVIIIIVSSTTAAAASKNSKRHDVDDESKTSPTYEPSPYIPVATPTRSNQGETPWPTITPYPTPAPTIPAQTPYATPAPTIPGQTPLPTPAPTIPGQTPFPTHTPTPIPVPTASPVPTPIPEPEYGELSDCSQYYSFSCTDGGLTMSSQYTDHLWNTPPRNTSRWEKGFQEMNQLVGYARQVYNFNHDQCTVTVITRTTGISSLTYYFDGIPQTDNTKVYDSTYTGLLQITIKADNGAILELDDVDFMWNNELIAYRAGDYRDGQKGAIVEMFGWMDEDIEQECEFLANAGYLGVKVFPHQEQVMSTQLNEGVLNPWHFMYQPVSYRLQGRAGNRTVLRNMIKKCRKYGVRVYADAVVNHMSGNGNDRNNHRNPSSGCTKWPGKQSSGGDMQSPYYTPAWTYEINPFTGRGTDTLEYPAVPYGPLDFHCDRSLNSWDSPDILNGGWLVGLTDLDTSSDYVRQRIADYFVDMISIGFSGFRIDAAKHIHPTDLAAIFAKFKAGMGGNLPADWITWLEVIIGGEAGLLLGSGDYSYSGPFITKMKNAGLSDADIDKVKIWWSGYPKEPWIGDDGVTNWRRAVQNDDHDQQNDGSSSRDMAGSGCVLVQGCSVDEHRGHEIKLFSYPPGANDNNNDYPIRFVLSSFYKVDGKLLMPDGQSNCADCKLSCDGCKGQGRRTAHGGTAYNGVAGDYTRVHRDQQIINAMRAWIGL